MTDLMQCPLSSCHGAGLAVLLPDPWSPLPARCAAEGDCPLTPAWRLPGASYPTYLMEAV